MGLTQTSEAGVKISNAGTNGQFLQKQSGNTGGLTWADVPAGVGGSNGADFNDNVKVRFGTGNDLELYHDGTWNYIVANNGNIAIQAKTNENSIVCIPDGKTSLYYDNSQKLETHNTGVAWSGDLTTVDGGVIKLGTGGDLQLYHDGSNSYVQNATGELHIRSNTLKLTDYNSSHVYLRGLSGNTTELYYDNAKKFETDSGGVKFFGNIYGGDNNEIRLGDNGDLQFFHHSSTGEGRIYNSNAGGLVLVSNSIKLRNQNNNELLIQAAADGAVKLYYDNSKKFETSSSGASLLGNLVLFDNNKLQLGDSNDLEIYHDGSNSYIKEQGNGTLRILGSAGVYINKHDDTETMAAFLHDAGVELYHNNVKKFETTSYGISAFTGSGTGAATGFGLQVFGGTSSRNSPAIYLSGGVNNSDNSAIFSKYNLTLGCNQSTTISDRTVEFVNGNNRVGAFSADGLLFGASDSAAANALDDYEEGSFDPVVRPSSNTFSITMHGDTGAYYTKIGRQVFVSGCVRWTAFTVGNASGNLLISLPFTAASRDNGDNSDDNWGFRVPVWNGSNRPNMGLTVAGQANMIMMYGTQGTDSVSPSHAGSTGMVQFSGHFRV